MTTDQVAVSDQLLIGSDNRIARDLQLLCKLATGRQLHAGRKSTVYDSVNDLLPNLILQIYGIIGINVDDDVLHALEDNSKSPGA